MKSYFTSSVSHPLPGPGCQPRDRHPGQRPPTAWAGRPPSAPPSEPLSAGAPAPILSTAPATSPSSAPPPGSSIYEHAIYEHVNSCLASTAPRGAAAPVEESAVSEAAVETAGFVGQSRGRLRPPSCASPQGTEPRVVGVAGASGRIKLNPATARAAIHAAKPKVGRGPADNVLFDARNGDIISPETGEVIGNLADSC
jgi:hypothetical protein